MRIDPCFASLDPDPLGAGCTAQLRLIFQEVTFQPRLEGPNGVVTSGVFAFDSGLHAFYTLSRAQALALARSLVDLRVTNESGDDLGRLAPHPIMVRQGLAGPMSQGVQRLILEYAGEQNLVRAAMSGFAGAGSLMVWEFSAFDIDGGNATPRPIPTLGSDGESAFGDAVLSGVLTGADVYVMFGRTSASDLDFTPLGNHPTNLSPSDLQAALDALVRVDNPRDSSPETVNCSACHMADPIESFVAMPVFGFDEAASPLAFKPDGQPTGIPNDFPNLHSFSYGGTQPSISRRVVNETAAVVEYLNALPGP
jgi:hypothetical protein